MKSDVYTRLVNLSYPEPNTGCWLFGGAVNHGGYGAITIDKSVKRAHRVMFELVNGVIPKDMIVCHSCDVPSCINPTHLFLGTTQTNSDDKVRKGRHTRGEDHWCSKMTAAQVEELKRLRRNGVSVKQLVEQFDISEASVYRIIRK